MDKNNNPTTKTEYDEIKELISENDCHTRHMALISRPLDGEKPIKLTIVPKKMTSGGLYEQISPIKTMSPFSFPSNEEPLEGMQSTRVGNLYEPMTPIKKQAPKSFITSAVYEEISPIKMNSKISYKQPWDKCEMNTPRKSCLMESTPKSKNALYDQVFPIRTQNHGTSLFLDSYEEPLEFMQSTKLSQGSSEDSYRIYEQMTSLKTNSKDSLLNHTYEEPLLYTKPHKVSKLTKPPSNSSLSSGVYEQITPVKPRKAKPRCIFSPRKSDNTSSSYEEPQNIMEQTSLMNNQNNEPPLIFSRIYEEISALNSKSLASIASISYAEPLMLPKRRTLKKCLLNLIRRKSHQNFNSSSNNKWCKSTSWSKITTV
uniref:Uncharacterized protein n=1 Tax=Musca domestica TaxID=7370 RepID=A0A1I8NJ44_MUSDO